MPRAQEAQERRVSVLHSIKWMNGYVQDERYTAGAGCAGAVPFSFARSLAQEAQERRVSIRHSKYFDERHVKLVQRTTRLC